SDTFAVSDGAQLDQGRLELDARDLVVAARHGDGPERGAREAGGASIAELARELEAAAVLLARLGAPREHEEDGAEVMLGDDDARLEPELPRLRHAFLERAAGG